MNLLFAINGGYIPTFLNCMRSVLLHGGASHYEVFIHYCGRLKPWKPHYVGVLDVFYHELMDEIQE